MPKCEDCGKDFATEGALAQHMKDRHSLAPSPPFSVAQNNAGSSKAAKKQKSLRRRNRHPVAIALAAVAVAAGLVVYFFAAPYFTGPPFPVITGESWIHVHPYLTISIDGTNVTIPADVGLVEGGSAFEPVHTHDDSGLLHIELSQADASTHNYTLGDFFTIWSYTAKAVGSSEAPTLGGKVLPAEFSSSDILGFRANSTYQVELIVDGKNCLTSTASPCPGSTGAWGSLDLENLDYCSSSNSGLPCCPTDCSSPAGPASDPLWDGTSNYPYGYGHTIVIEYVKV